METPKTIDGWRLFDYGDDVFAARSREDFVAYIKDRCGDPFDEEWVEEITALHSRETPIILIDEPGHPTEPLGSYLDDFTKRGNTCELVWTLNH